MPEQKMSANQHNQGPPDLDALLKKFFKNIFGPSNGSNRSSKIFQGKIPTPRMSKTKYLLGAGIIFFLWLISGFFIVQPQNVPLFSNLVAMPIPWALVR